MNEFDVTIIIPNFNRTAPLRRAIASIKTQSCKPREIIVIDDCSNPETLLATRSIIAEFGDDLDIELLINEKNMGANFSRNRGLWAASSSYVAFLDSDDFWMPDKLEIQMDRIRDAKASDGRPVLSATGRYRVNDGGLIIARQFGGKLLDKLKISKSNFIGTLSSVVVDTSAAKGISGFNETLRAAQDWDFFIRLSNRVQFVGIEHPLCIYVDHDEERITSNSRRRILSHLQIRRMHRTHDGYPKMVMQSLFKIMAEDLQNAGEAKKARIFYAKHKYLTKSKAFRLCVPEWIMTCFYSHWGMPNLKSMRYEQYRQVLDEMRRDPVQRRQLEHHQRTIARMMQ